MPRFVVLRHEREGEVHWDFLLEAGPSFVTWALEQPPDTPGIIGAKSLPGHRPEYFEYEGPISGDRGTVTRWDRGEYELNGSSETDLTATLSGCRLQGTVVLRCVISPPDRWEFSYAPA